MRSPTSPTSTRGPQPSPFAVRRTDPARKSAPPRCRRWWRGWQEWPRIALVAATLATAGAAAAAALPAHPAPPPSALDWNTSPLDLDLRGMNGERYRFQCPPGKARPSHVVGSGPYADGSSICSAAVHAGAISAREGGAVWIEIRPGQSRYAGSERNYLRSADYDGAWGGSFVIVNGAAVDVPHPRGDPP